uniref:Uncharacterized protein n=1 Tax=viral metagenome TaxID=1070528 RepID=A0A6C0IHJ4_9ZZZZ
MSLVTLKRKSVIQYGSKRSAKPPGGYWLPQGPFGNGKTMLEQAIQNPGSVGFSLNGSHRNVGGVGKESKFSKNGTPFRGTQPMGSGGSYGKYATPEPVFNTNKVIVEGTQYQYIKPTVLTNYGMLNKKYRCIHNGQYPNHWVQPVNTGNLTDSSSQGQYIHDKAVANMCVSDINNPEKYEGYKRCHQGTAGSLLTALCEKSIAKSTYDNVASNGKYSKQIRQPNPSSVHTLQIQRKCAYPTATQKPFPFAVQTGSGILTGGTRVTNVGNSCGTSQNIYLTPPAWYTRSR